MARTMEKVIEIKPIVPKTIVVTIQGDSDLVLSELPRT